MAGIQAPFICSTLVRPSFARLVEDHADIVIGRPDQASGLTRAYANAVLDDGERSRAARFVFERDRELFIFSHGLLRLILARYLNADARELRFTTSPGGRPELAGAGGVQIRFNLSHTDGLIAYVITRCADCGVDVECLGRVDYRDLVASVLAPSECEAVFTLDEGSRRDRFLEIWTLKEAYIKGRGLGLSHPLREVAFSGFDDERRCTIGANVSNDGHAWRFWSGKPTSWHRAAAALRTDGRAATFSIIEGAVFP